MRDWYFKHKPTAILLALFCMFLWGSAFPMIKLGYEALEITQDDFFGKLFFAGLRFTLAGVLVYFYHYLLKRKPIPFEKKSLPLMLYLSFFQMSGQYFFFYIALAYTTGVKSSVLQASSTFMTILLAHFLLKNDKLNQRKTLALLLGFSGIICANFTKGFDWHFTFMGEGFMLIAALLSSFGNILVKKTGKSNPFFLASGQFFIGGGTLLVIGYLGLDQGLNFTPYSLTLLLYGSFISSTAFVLWYSLLLYQPVGEISIYRLFIPIFGALLSSLLIPGESFTFAILGGLLLVILGVLILNRPQKRLPLPSKD